MLIANFCLLEKWALSSYIEPMESMKSIKEEMLRLSDHEVYRNINSIENLRVFMKTHVFAVWDFMSLLKALQNQLTCTSVPWRPSPYSKQLVRIINEIVLGEESDLDPHGNPCDHYTLYIQAMQEVQASTKEVESFIESMDFNKLPSHIKNFVSFNLDLALNKEAHEIAGAFLFGREELIPDMFSGIIKHLKKDDYPMFHYYLDRHIELDGDSHSGLAALCLEELCKGDESKLEEAYKVGLQALKLRRELWDGALKEIQKSSPLYI